jgi:p-hydroxybenzoate 3-monooxygenase
MSRSPTETATAAVGGGPQEGYDDRMLSIQTSVAIIGAGPAGLMLSQLLANAGIASCVLERSSRAHVESRVRAGVLEQASVDALCASGVGERLLRERLVHRGVELRFGGASHRIDFAALVPGRSVSVYGQREVVRDLIAAREAAGAIERRALMFEAPALGIEDVDGRRPSVTFSLEGKPCRLEADWVVGCDGFHGLARRAMAAPGQRVYEHAYPFAWLGILAAVPPSSHELIYAAHERGFALHSLRSPEISRFYLQVSAEEDLGAWSDERIWAELRTRLETVPGWALASGQILERGLAAMRSFVVEPMRQGRLLLAGDAAHIVPATGAKGLNLALHDVGLLHRAFAEWYGAGRTALLDGYSEACLRRVWRVQQFSSWMTKLLHVDPAGSAFDWRVQLAQLDHVASSRAASTVLAESYVGEWPGG